MSHRDAQPGRAAAVAAAVLLLDQVTKGLVRGGIERGDRIELVAGIDLVRVDNRGIAFGMLDNVGPLVLVLASLVFAGLLVYFLLSSEQRGLWLPIGLLAGGAVGNLVDRVREGAVTDFIDLPAWPAFNLADVAITAGVIVLLVVHVFGLEPRPPDGEEQDPPRPVRP